MKRYLEVVADTNDADYISNRKEVSIEQLLVLRPILKVISECKEYHNWPNNEYQDETPYDVYKDLLTKEQIDLIGEYFPYGENGIHTIESAKVLLIEEQEILL